MSLWIRMEILEDAHFYDITIRHLPKEMVAFPTVSNCPAEGLVKALP